MALQWTWSSLIWTHLGRDGCATRTGVNGQVLTSCSPATRTGVNLKGMFHEHVLTSCSPATRTGVNLKGMFLTVQASAREMVRWGKGGRIVTLSSLNAVKGAK